MDLSLDVIQINELKDSRNYEYGIITKESSGFKSFWSYVYFMPETGNKEYHAMISRLTGFKNASLPLLL
jgi:hypothetical protein